MKLYGQLYFLQGVLCYMLLSGSPPFYGKTVEDVYKATSTQDPVFPDKKFRYREFKTLKT